MTAVRIRDVSLASDDDQNDRRERPPEQDVHYVVLGGYTPTGRRIGARTVSE